MTSENHQMREARAQFRDVVRQSLGFVCVLLCAVIVLELWFRFDTPWFFLGVLTGSSFAFFNLWLLFFMFAPYFFRQEKPLYVFYGGVLSLVLGALLIFFSLQIGPHWSLGLAFGIGSPAFIGAFYGLQAISQSSRT